MRKTLGAQTGAAFQMMKGDQLEVIDLHGEQVSDLFCFSAEEPHDALSSGRTIDYNETIRLTTGHRLFANSGKVMMTIVEDSGGSHDFLVTPCSLQMFQMISGTDDYHPSCQENLAKAFAEFGISESAITTTFNVFMNVPVDDSGRIRVLPPSSRAGDRVVFRAEMDLLVGLTACSDEGTNNGRCKPIAYEIHPRRT